VRPEGVIYQGREGLDQWKSAHAAKTDARTLEEALKGADIFLGLSAAGALKPEMVKDMAPRPIIFAMANPDPESLRPRPKPHVPTQLSQRVVRITRTRSTTSSASPSSSEVRWTCARPRSTTK
jgi:malate dehydrogenase (oxaloacetate-decarboxylating)(NADP+)